MKILFVTPYLPAPPNFGGARRMYELIRGAARRHEVITLSLCGPDDDPHGAEAEIGRVVPVPVSLTARMPPGRSKRLAQLRSLASPRSFQQHLYRHAAMQQAIDLVLRDEHIDLAQLEFSQMGGYRVAAGTPSLLDVHNIEHDVLRQVAAAGPLSRRLFNLIEERKFRREEIAAWRRVTHCLATAPDDARRIEDATGRPVSLIPNGVDTSYFSRAPLAEGDVRHLIFVGAMRYQPNADAAMFFVDQVLPCLQQAMPDIRLTIVGADPPPDVVALAAQPGVVVTGTVPDVRPWLRQAGIVVVPLRSGGGTRLKILEAFAAGRPVVATTIGAAGIDARHEVHLLLADTPADFRDAISRLVQDPELRNRLVDRAAGLVRERYEWSKINDQLEELYQRIRPERLF